MLMQINKGEKDLKLLEEDLTILFLKMFAFSQFCSLPVVYKTLVCGTYGHMHTDTLTDDYLNYFKKKAEGAVEDEMIRQRHQLNGHEFERTLGDSGGQRHARRIVAC